MDLLRHEVAVVRLVDQRRCRRVLDRLAVDDGVVLVEDRGALAIQHHPIAVLEIADRIGERPERDRVGPEKHLAFAMADRERRAVAGADHQVILAGEDEAERERAAQLRQHRPHRLDRLDAALEQIVDQMHHDLGVGLGRERRTLGLELLAQLAEILDDAVMHHGDAFGGVRVRVVLGRPSVRGPAGVADAGMAAERLGLEPGLEILQLALGTAPRQAAILQRGDTRGIIAAIFEPLERIH
ncbi:hypothetical protein ACVI1L_006992 [Bradyrhizobium sp. USDA 4516]